MGAALLRDLSPDHSVTGFNHAQLDLSAPEQLREKLHSLDFDLLLNAAAQTNVDRCEKEPEEAFALNAAAPEIMAQICARKRARLIHISTDYVFDGEQRQPYREGDEARPLSVYGESKLEGERRILQTAPEHLVVRVSWVFGPDRPSFVDWVMQQAREKELVSAVADKYSTPTYTLDLARMLRPLLTAPDACGLLHLANAGECSWREYGQWALDCCKAEGIALRAETVEAITLADMENFIARRPIYTVLATGKWEKLTGAKPRDWRAAVAEYVRTEVKARLT